ncbi:MAG TPA: saccharopine dehydrogenase NADP-binding domain-containing protein [Solirubrobacteraceae bacterium]|nr:saccharopine dehydrogenase NADP-binding domain-containing protein [Solirubrobacteraceae bacterium]
MAGRIVLFGATGYTGELTARELVGRGARPVLVGRSAERLGALAEQLGGGLETAVVDATAPRAVAELAALAGPGDVLVCTVGPFMRWGETGVGAALQSGAHYIDSTGEPPFIRSVFERHGPAAEAAGCGLLTALGYDYVPGNLAGALALRGAGDRAVSVDVGYFVSGGGGGGAQASGGTRASAAGMLTEPGYEFRGGRLETQRAARHVRDLDGRPAISVGATEQFALPRVHPGLRDITVWLGWFGPASRPLQAMSAATAVATKVPGVRGAIGAVAERFVKGSTGGPPAGARAKAKSHIVAVASDAGGRELATVRLRGVNPYDFTAGMLAWGAMRAASGGLLAAGALGPVDGFGLDELEAGVAEAGISHHEEQLP